MTVAELFRKWDLKQTLFIRELGISKQGFSQKVNENLPFHYFTDAQKDKLKKVLKELAKDIDKVK